MWDVRFYRNQSITRVLDPEVEKYLVCHISVFGASPAPFHTRCTPRNLFYAAVF
jgi:hypothetical protein